MKKILFTAVAILFFFPAIGFAEEQDMEVTTTIPSTYTLTIPSSQSIVTNSEKMICLL